MKKILAQIIIVTIFLLFTPKLQAKELNLTVAPSVYEVITKKNKEITLPYTFVNLGDPHVFNLKIYRLIPNNSKTANILVPYEQSEKGITFRIDDPSYTLDTPFFLSTKEELTIDLIINIPADINEKDYYFTFVLEGAEGESAQETAIELQGGVGTNIFITVSEDASRTIEGKISLFEIPSKYTFSWGGRRFAIINSSEPIRLVLQVANTGGNLVKASGSITLSNLFSYFNKEKNPSITISKTYIPSENQVILQSQEDRFCDQNSDFPACQGEYSAIISSPSWFGVYTATAGVYLNENSKVLYDSAYVAVLPVSGIITIVIILIIITSSLVLLKRKVFLPTTQQQRL